MNNQQRSAMQMALRKAFNLGQKYWQQADSEYASHWKKADATKAKFEELVEETDAALREALAQPQCNPHPDAPHGFDRNASHSANRYVCECEGWEPEQAEQEPFDMDDHPPHRLCECRKCMEYFTPLPDCDAFAASGKPIAGQTNTQLMEGYRIGLAEMREKCATVSEQGTGEAVQKATLELLLNERKRITLAIRAINFEGDTGFRPVSEMIAEHKQDPKKAAAIEKAKMRKAEQEPVGYVYMKDFLNVSTKDVAFTKHVEVGTDLYAAPVRTKDLTDDEIMDLVRDECVDMRWPSTPLFIARAVIAADRRKNRW